MSKQSPLSGTYERVDADGLFWSMSRGMAEKATLNPRQESLEPIEFLVAAAVDGREVAQSKFQRLLVAPGVGRVRVNDSKLRGSFFIPAGKGPHPGLIVLGGSEGGLHEMDAAFLASEGYSALALAYFAFEDLPTSLENIPLEYFRSAIDWLQQRKEVRPNAIGVMGRSRGGELSLLLGSTFPQIKAVVAVSPSGVIWGGISSSDTEQPAWTFCGQPLAFMSNRNLPPDQREKLARMMREPSFCQTQVFAFALEDKPAAQKASIAVERINGPVLLISGCDDRIWPSTIMSDMVMERLKRSMHQFPDCHFAYKGVGHFIPLPGLPATVRTLRMGQLDIPLGGESEPTATAAIESWVRINGFLRDVFGRIQVPPRLRSVSP